MNKFNTLKTLLLLSTGLYSGAYTSTATADKTTVETEKFFVGKITQKTIIDKSDSTNPLLTLVNALDLTVLISDKLENMLQPLMTKKFPPQHHEKLIQHFKNKIEDQPQHIQTLQMSYIDSVKLPKSIEAKTIDQITELFKKYGTSPIIEFVTSLKTIMEKNIKSSISKEYTPTPNTKKIEFFTEHLLKLAKELNPVLGWLSLDDEKIIKAATAEIESLLNMLNIAIDDLIPLIDLKSAREFFKIWCQQEDHIIATFQKWSGSVLGQIIQDIKKKGKS